MDIYPKLFGDFFKIGLFTIGGGYAMLPLIEDDVVRRRGWISSDDFPDLVAVAQAAPGVFAVNISIFIGYRLRGSKGAVVATLGAVLPSFIIILAIALSFGRLRDNVYLERIFMGIRPAVAALMAVPVISLGRKAHLNPARIILAGVCALAIWWASFPPVYLVAIAIGGGLAAAAMSAAASKHRDGG